MISRSKSHIIRYLILLVCIAIFVIGLPTFIQMKYQALIQTPQLLEDFYSSDQKNLPLLRKKYSIDYARISSGKVVENSMVNLPRLDLYMVYLVKNPLVIPNSLRDSLKYTRPYVFYSSSSLYIVFPLVFPEKADSFLIIKKITP